HPILDPGIRVFYAAGTGREWAPMLAGGARVSYGDTKLGIAESRDVLVVTPISEGAVPVNWDRAEPAPFSVPDLTESVPDDGPATFAPLPGSAARPKSYQAWEKAFARWLAGSQTVEIWRSRRLKTTSHLDEDERSFRIRLQTLAREARDAAVEKVRQKYAPKLQVADERVRRAEQALSRESRQAADSRIQAGVSIAATVVGALLGRKTLSTSTLGRATAAARGMSRAGREAEDIARAEATLAAERERRDALAAEFEQAMRQAADAWDPLTEPLDRVLLKPARGGVAVQFVALVWVPRG
ncbi:MAG: ATP-binding protein, partial [Acidobacteriota bacterium]